MDALWPLLLWALVGTLFLFLETLGCVLFETNLKPLFTLIPAALAPLPMLVARATADDDVFGASSRFRHWAEFLSCFLATGVIAVPVLLWTTGHIAMHALLLSLSGFVLLAVAATVAAVVRARSRDEALIG